MNRREFLVAAMASAGAATLPAWARIEPESMPRAPLVVHTSLVQPVRYFWEVGAWLEVVDTPRGPCLSTGADVFGVGDALTVQLLESGMGHYSVALMRNDVVIRRFDSNVAGPLLERGEPLAALVTDVSGERFRVDVYLDRPVEPGERISLLDPAIEHSGVSADLVYGAAYVPLQAGWHPLRFERWHLPMASSVTTEKLEGWGDGLTVQKITRSPWMSPIPARRRMIYNNSPWSDLDPAVAVLTQNGRDIAMLPFRIGSDIEHLLLRGERIEAQLLKPGGLGEVRVDLSLVA